MRLCVIPARGGSKRIPRKNIRLFCGKPMLMYAIEKALARGLFDAVLVSSEDDEILSLAEQNGVTPIKRPRDLADDYTSTVPVVAHAINIFRRFGYSPKLICCIYPAVPFLEVDDLVLGLKLLQQYQADYIFPVTPFSSAIQRALRLVDDARVLPFFPEHESTRTQDLEPAYHDAGQFYWGSSEAWLLGKNIHSHGHGLEIPSWRAVDIDTLDDWHLAELVYQALIQKERGE